VDGVLGRHGEPAPSALRFSLQGERLAATFARPAQERVCGGNGTMMSKALDLL
jgi:hypothetical protein